VVGVSEVVELDPPICEYCGGFILPDDQECPARAGGRCHP
jgi:hypothetical protein